MIEFVLERIADPYVREVVQRIREEFKNQALLRGQWRFVEISFTDDITGFLYPHRMGFRPTDIIQTSKTGTGDITYEYSLFDSTNLNITTDNTDSADPLTVRFFVGRYEEGSKV